MKGISILIFAYNEEKHILDTLKLIYSCIAKTKIKFEIIVLNDGSKDDTKKKVENFKKKIKKIKIINFKKNMGISRSLRYGIKISKYEKLTWFAGDNSFLRKNLKKFFLLSEKSDIVNGFRHNKYIFKNSRKILTILNNFFINILFKQRIKDVHGLFIFNTKDLKKLKFYSTRYSIMVEILPSILNLRSFTINFVKVYLNNKTLDLSQTLSFQTIFDFAKTWIKSFYYFKILN
tara:strand:- start:33 stop:731 length:699 start_codon:yes stop_codon:yes gene_type:complete